MNSKEMVAEANRLFAEAKALLQKPPAEISGEDQQKIEKCLEEGKRLKGLAVQLDDVAMLGVEQAKEQEEKAQRDEARTTGFKTLGEFLVAVARAGNIRDRGPIDPRLRSFRDLNEPQDEPRDWMNAGPGTKAGWATEGKATMVENIGARGGFLVPMEYRPELQALTPEANVVRARATIIPMSRRQITLPVLDQTGTTAGQGHWFGGVVAKWTEEAESKTQTEPTFRQAVWTAHKLVVYSEASDELLEDEAVGLQAFLSGPMGFAGAINWEEQFCFLRGTGVGQPLGVITAGATITIPRVAANAVGFPDLADMMEAFYATGGRGIWMISQTLMSEMIQLNGPAGNPSYIWQPNARDGIPGSILGMPVVWTEKLPTKGNRGDVLLVNWPYYVIGDRRRTTVESTNIYKFQYDVTSWRCVHRVDGRPWLSAPFTLQDGTAQISPFVVLGDKTT